MGVVNALLGRFVEAALFPFRNLPPVVGLSVVSLVTAAGMLLVFRATSDQRRLSAVKRAIHAGFFEMRLFNDDLRALLRAQVEILRQNLVYLRLSLVPLLWMLVPLVLLVAHLQFYYGYRGLQPGGTALVKVRVKSELATGAPDGGGPALALEAPPGLRVETPVVWIPALDEAAWRIGAERAGDYELAVSVDGRALTKSVRVSDALGRRSPVRPGASWLDQLLYPAETAIPADAPVESVSVTYPDRPVSLFGWELHWMVVFFALSLIFALLLRRPFGVVI
jgi:uncharacterized membrane protein (DUF106 family)